MQALPSLNPTVRKTLILLAAVATVGCGPLNRGTGTDRARIVVDNQSVYEAALYGSLSGREGYRIGAVMPGRTDTLTVPLTIEGRTDVTLYAQLVGSSARPTSMPVTIREGEWIYLRVPSSLNTLIISAAP